MQWREPERQVDEWGSRAWPLAVGTLKAVVLVNLCFCPLHSREYRTSKKVSLTWEANGLRGFSASAWESLPPREALVNKLLAAWVAGRWCWGHRLSGMRKLERLGTGQCHISQSRGTLGLGSVVPEMCRKAVSRGTSGLCQDGLYISCFLHSVLSSAFESPTNILGNWRWQKSGGRRQG